MISHGRASSLSGEVLSGCLGQTLTQYLTRISQNVWKVQSTGCHPRMVATMRMPIAQPPLSNYISHPKVYIHTTCITRAASHSVDFLWSVCGPSQVKPFLHPVTFLLTGHSVPQNLAQASVTPRLRRLISSVNQTIKHFDWLCKMCMLL